jgi:hypothetical protein
MLKALKMRNITERIGHEFYPKVARCDGWEFRPAGAWILLITLPGATFPPLRSAAVTLPQAFELRRVAALLSGATELRIF